MIYSMTGFGKASLRYGTRTITVAIKSLNSKQSDLSARVPSAYRTAELELRSLITSQLQRGKIDLSISIDDDALEGNASLINREALIGYVHQLRALSSELGQELPLDTAALLRLPGVLDSESTRQPELGEEELAVLRQATQQAVDELTEFRRQEGVMLYEVLAERIQRITALLAEITYPEAERIQQVRQRLEEGLRKLMPSGDYDRSRLEQELIYYIEKLDINEEKSRLAHHLS
ncbi:MAG: hypothetical protein HXL26_03230, partial [Porphyromonadaceae bacterium]|nr:hypothetical protein [Porphyromonadaceae bacterium]